MRHLFIPVYFLLITSGIYAQQDPEAKAILDKAADKTNTCNTIQANFKLDIEDRKEMTSSTSEGRILVKGNKYRLESNETIVFFDGKTMWTYSKDINEVTITEPNMEGEDFLGNPAKILMWYNRDFKYRYVQETSCNGILMHEIDLFPKNLDQPYTRIKLFLGTKDLLLYSVKSVGKEGIDYTVKLTDYLLDNDLDDAIFVFNPAKYKKTEIIDMRF